MKYGEYDVNDGVVTPASEVKEGSQENGLVLAVPMLRRDENGSSVWLPLYGSNLDGFYTTSDVGNTADSMERALLTAALNQCLYDKGWYLEWSDERAGLEGCLSDLPGLADRIGTPQTGDDSLIWWWKNLGRGQVRVFIIAEQTFFLLGGCAPIKGRKQFIVLLFR